MLLQAAIQLLAFSALQGDQIPPAPPATPPACLGRKDARRLQKTRSPEKRLLVYTAVAAGGAGGLLGCLSPEGSTWVEGKPPFGLPSRPCPGIDDMLAVVHCAEGGIREELAAWKRSGSKAEEALRTAYGQLRMSGILLDQAEDEARQPGRGLGPVPANRIRSCRLALGDDEDRIVRLLRAGRP